MIEDAVGVSHFGRTGSQVHCDVADEMKLWLEAQPLPFNIGTGVREYRQGEYIYDLYFPEEDLVVEVGRNRFDKLNWLLENKTYFMIAWPKVWEMSEGLGDWLFRLNRSSHVIYYNKFQTDSAHVLLVSRHKGPGMKHASDWVADALHEQVESDDTANG